MSNTSNELHIIGAGLAGSEAAWQAANLGAPNGIKVILHEMRPKRGTPAHETGNAAELVCSNSFRSDDDEHNAVGLIHYEMRTLNSLIMREGDRAAVPAGGALAVDRDIFSEGVTKALTEHPNITIETDEVTEIPKSWKNVIIATGPLTSDALSDWIKTQTGEDELAFFDAIAPIVHADSINMDIAWKQSRYDKGSGSDYINCPMTKEQYEAFITELTSAEYGLFKEWELPSGSKTLAEQEEDTPYFDGCMPIEIMAARGPETLRFGPMKPVGLTNPHKGEDEQPYAVVQLRQDNALGTLYNIVGFQTKMKWGEQTRVFRTIPGLKNAEFARLGGLHRNTFINSPKILDNQLRLIRHPRGLAQQGLNGGDPEKSSLEEAAHMDPVRASVSDEARQRDDGQVIRFAGQITGCEGYIESASIGLIAGRLAAAEIVKENFQTPPLTTALGALLNHVTGGANAETFQPMNVNFGLFPLPDNPFQIMPNGKRKKLKGLDRKKAYTTRAKTDLRTWMESLSEQKAA